MQIVKAVCLLKCYDLRLISSKENGRVVYCVYGKCELTCGGVTVPSTYARQYTKYTKH